jgi:molybdopterin converting factor subunit 1
MIHVTVLFFAVLRELVGQAEAELELPGEVTQLAELLPILEQQYPALRGKLLQVRVAVNESFVDAALQLKDHDVIALIPPVAGG